jgi:hypothetical protein
MDHKVQLQSRVPPKGKSAVVVSYYNGDEIKF